jgi:hypothetical protein
LVYPIMMRMKGGDTMNIYIVKYQEPNGEVQMVEYPASEQQAMLGWIGKNTWIEIQSVRLVSVVETYKVNFSATLSKK